MTTLENFYYGNIDPSNKYIKRGSEYSKRKIKRNGRMKNIRARATKLVNAEVI